MLKFSLPVIIGGAVLAVGATLGTVAVAMPGNYAPVPAPTYSLDPAPESTPVTPGTEMNPYVNLQREIAPGVRVGDLAAGLSVNITATGATFSYVGPCLDADNAVTVWSNVPGMWKSRSNSSYRCPVGQQTYRYASITWSEDTRNGYCSSPLGAQSAFRAEFFGQFTQWVPIPEAYKQCVDGRAPEGAIPGAAVSASAAPVSPAPATVSPVVPAPVVTPSAPALSSSTPIPTP
jgi:hypothetical protein